MEKQETAGIDASSTKKKSLKRTLILGRDKSYGDDDGWKRKIDLFQIARGAMYCVLVLFTLVSSAIYLARCEIEQAFLLMSKKMLDVLWTMLVLNGLICDAD